MTPPSVPPVPQDSKDQVPQIVTVDAAAAEKDDFGPTCLDIELHGTRRRLDVAETSEVLIGRTSEATITIDDERISRRHLRIVARQGVLWAVDLGSRNGTLLNGKRLVEERRLRGGDLLELGPLRIRVGGARREAALLDEGDLIDRLDEEVERARAFKRPLSVVGLVLKGPLGSIDEAVKRLLGRLGRTDSAGEYAAGRVLVLLPERTLTAAEAAGRTFLQLADEVAGVYMTAAAAAVPESGREVEELLAAAFPQGPSSEVSPARSGPVVVDAATVAVFDTARRVARSPASVLITGESGAGKEWVAATIHTAGPRGKGPYVRVNCAALPDNLIESELFGHERGAFTGAEKRRIGRIEAASGGTLFLDEIGELPLHLQAKLLHVIEDRSVVRLGANDRTPVDVRFVAATNRDLEAEVRGKRFREDLYYRLNAIPLSVPPLRDRPADLIPLAEHFLVAAARGAGMRPLHMDAGFRTGLLTYPWPGNIRELKNVIERAVALSQDDILTRRELPERLRSTDAPTVATGPIRVQIDDLERRTIEAALAECGDNRTHAARKLGISRRTLIYKLHKFGMID